MILLTRRMHFSASHRLHNPAFSDEKNRDVYGVCNNPHGHGHNYVLEVTVSGEPDPQTGMIVDLKVLKKIIWEEVVIHMDHKHLNHDVPFLEGIIPTAENIARVIWERLAGRIPAGTLYEVKLYESENNYVVYRG